MKKFLIFISMLLVANLYAQQQIYFTTFPANPSPNGWEKEIILGEYNWYFGEIVLPGSTIFSAPAAVFNDDIAMEQGNQAVLTSPVWNLGGYQTVSLSYEYGLNRTGGGGKIVVEVYDGSNWQEVAMYDETQTPVMIDPIDVTAYKNAAFSVRFTYDDEYSYGMGGGITNFLLEGTSSTAPNSQCWNATLLNCGDTGQGTTINSTIKDELAPHGGLDPNGSYGVWYKYSDMGNQSDVTFSLCDTTEAFDSKVIVYQGACADLFPVASNDDACGTYSEVSFHNDGTSTYYILVFGDGQTTSDFTYNFSCQDGAPANDDIENAIDVDQFDQPYTDFAVPLINATMEDESADFVNTGCDMGGGWYPNVFYKFTAEQNGNATATFTTPNDGGFQIIAFYTAPNENAAISDLTFVNQPTNGCNQMSQDKSIEISEGTTYYVVMMSPYTNSDIVINLDYVESVENVEVTTQDNIEPEVYVGETLQLEANILPEEANQEVIWTMESGEEFASVDESGLVTGIAPGIATVRATSVDDPLIYDEIQVNILEYAVQSVEVITQGNVEPEIYVEETLQLEANILPEEANQEVIWTVESGEEFASVNESGLVTGNTPGVATVRATSAENSSIYGEIEVTVKENLSVSDLSNSSFTIYPNPVKDILNISGKSKISKVEVFELSGKLMKSQTAGSKNIQLNLTSMNNGAYIIKVSSDKTTEIFKIIKK